MTTNAIVATVAGDWVDLHAGASLPTGTALTIQIKTQGRTNVVFVDSTAKPTGDVDTAGGLETNGAFAVVNSSPMAGESTWARLRSDAGTETVNISVQD